MKKNNNKFKIPEFISGYFSTLSKEEKEKAIERYKIWEESEFTSLFTEWLDSLHKRKLEEDENNISCESQFQFRSKLISNRAERKLITFIKNKINWRYNV